MTEMYNVSIHSRRSDVQGHLGLHRQFKTTLETQGRPFLNNNNSPTKTKPKVNQPEKQKCRLSHYVPKLVQESWAQGILPALGS